VHGDPTGLPFPDASFDRVVCLDILDRIRDDDFALAELARVVRPGGLLVLRVPQAGPTAGLDAQNLFRYSQSFAGRGAHPRNCGEHGWRRHYRRCDVRQLVAPHFRIRRLVGRGLALAEPVNLAMLLLCGVHLDGLAQRLQPLASALTCLDERLPAGGWGFRMLVVAERR